MKDGVDLDAQVVSNGVAQWNAAGTALNSTWQNSMSGVEALHGEATWGSDEAGRQFLAAYKKSGGPDFRTTGNPVIRQILDQGPKVTAAVERSLSADEMAAVEVRIPIKGMRAE